MIYSKILGIVIVNYCLCENKWFKKQWSPWAAMPLLQGGGGPPPTGIGWGALGGAASGGCASPARTRTAKVGTRKSKVWEAAATRYESPATCCSELCFHKKILTR